MGVSASFSAPFRAQVASWLTRVGEPAPGGRVRTFSLGAQRLMVADCLELPSGTDLPGVIVIARNLRLGDRCRIGGPIFAGGAVETGKRCRLMAVAAGSRLLLGSGTAVSDWADATGEVLLRAGAEVGGPVAGRRVELSPESSAGALFSPEISFGGNANREVSPGRRTLLKFPDHAMAVAGFRPEKLSALDARTWFYDGSLRFVSPLDLSAHLVVRGSFECGAGSVIDGDVKAGAGIGVGPESIVRGNLISLAGMQIGDGTYFSGDLQAAGGISLGAGACGFSGSRAVKVECKGALLCGAQVLIRGEARAHQRILARPVGADRHEDLFEYREIC